MRVFKRTWKSPTGEPRAAWVVELRNPLKGDKVERRTLKNLKTKAEAEGAAALLFADLTRRAMLGADAGPSLEEKALTLRELLDAHARRSGVSPWTVSLERSKIAFLCRLLGESKSVVELKQADVEVFKVKRQAMKVRRRVPIKGKPKSEWPVVETNVKPQTVNKELVLLKSAMNYAKTQGKLSEIPVEFRLLNSVAPRRRLLTPGDSSRILREAKARRPALFEALAFLANTGLRPAELWRMTWRDVDLRARSLSVVTAKHGRSGTVRRDTLPLNPHAFDVLTARVARLFPGMKTPPPDALVFGTPPEKRSAARNGQARGPKGTLDGVEFYGVHRLNQSLKSLAVAAGVDRPHEVTLYAFRHGLATAALQSGANVRDVAEMLRHRDPAMTLRVYAHADQKAIRRTLDAIAIGPSESDSPAATDREGGAESA